MAPTILRNYPEPTNFEHANVICTAEHFTHEFNNESSKSIVFHPVSSLYIGKNDVFDWQAL